MVVTVESWNDARTWNEFVASVPHAHFQQGWEWGDLAPDLGGEAVRLGALKDGHLAGAMQVVVNPVGRSGKSLLYVPRGPALCEPTVQVLGPLADAARALGRERDAIGIRLEPNIPAEDRAWANALGGLAFHPSYPPTQPRSSWLLDIAPDADTLLAGMKQKTRYNIRLAERKGVVVEAAGPDDLDAFYDLYRETAARDDFFVQPKSVYCRMFDVYRDAGQFCMLLARFGGEILAAVTLIRFGTTCWYMHGASGNKHRNLMPTYLLQWRSIEWAKSQSCTLYDFRAVPDILREDQDMYGVYRFKEGFGGYQFTTLPTYAASYRSGLFGLWQVLFSGRFAADAWLRRRKGLPARQFA